MRTLIVAAFLTFVIGAALFVLVLQPQQLPVTASGGSGVGTCIYVGGQKVSCSVPQSVAGLWLPNTVGLSVVNLTAGGKTITVYDSSKNVAMQMNITTTVSTALTPGASITQRVVSGSISFLGKTSKISFSDASANTVAVGGISFTGLDVFNALFASSTSATTATPCATITIAVSVQLSGQNSVQTQVFQNKQTCYTFSFSPKGSSSVVGTGTSSTTVPSMTLSTTLMPYTNWGHWVLITEASNVLTSPPNSTDPRLNLPLSLAYSTAALTTGPNGSPQLTNGLWIGGCSPCSWTATTTAQGTTASQTYYSAFYNNGVYSVKPSGYYVGIQWSLSLPSTAYIFRYDLTFAGNSVYPAFDSGQITLIGFE